MTIPSRLRGALCLVLWSLSACASWQTGAPPTRAATYETPLVRVYQNDGRPVVIHRPVVLGDSLHGWSADPDRTPLPDPVSIALADVVRVEQREPDGRRSAALLAGVAAGVVAVGGLMWATFLFSGT